MTEDTRPALPEPDPPHQREDYRDVWLSGWRSRNAEVAHLTADRTRLEQERDALRLSHPAEGTFPCTCRSYPHSPNCGLDDRLVALRAKQDAAERQQDALRALVTTWRTEAAAEQRVSFCADALEALLSPKTRT